jgi:hypothetical protein
MVQAKPPDREDFALLYIIIYHREFGFLSISYGYYLFCFTDPALFFTDPTLYFTDPAYLTFFCCWSYQIL